MSAKVQKASSKKSETKAAPKAAEGKKAGGKGPAKVEAKARDKAAIPEIVGGAENIDPEEAEEQAAEAASKSSSAGGADAALAAANSSTEMSASFKNFRHHPDMENFYRFIYENDLRHEAMQIIDVIMVEKQARKQLKAAKAHAH